MKFNAILFMAFALAIAISLTNNVSAVAPVQNTLVANISFEPGYYNATHLIDSSGYGNNIEYNSLNFTNGSTFVDFGGGDEINFSSSPNNNYAYAWFPNANLLENQPFLTNTPEMNEWSVCIDYALSSSTGGGMPTAYIWSTENAVSNGYVGELVEWELGNDPNIYIQDQQNDWQYNTYTGFGTSYYTNDSTWRELCYVYSGNQATATLEVYVDGNLVPASSNSSSGVYDAWDLSTGGNWSFFDNSGSDKYWAVDNLRVYTEYNPFDITACGTISVSGTYTLLNNISGANCLDVTAPNVIINAQNYSITGTGGQSAIFLSTTNSDPFTLNDGTLIASTNDGALKFGNGINGLTLNRTQIISTGASSRGIRQTTGTVLNLILDSVNINAGQDALFLITANTLTIKDSHLVGNVDGSFGALTNANIYNNYIEGAVLGGTGTSSSLYNNTINGSFSASNVWTLNTTLGNTWTNPSQTGYSDTCLNDGFGVCETPYTLGSSTDYLPVALSPYCASNWVCLGYGASSCLINDTSTAMCNSVNDTNACGRSYTGDYTEFTNQTGSCDYCTPDFYCDGYFNGTCTVVNGTGTSTYSCNSVADNNSCFSQTGLASDEFTGNPATYDSGVNSCEATSSSYALYGMGVLISLVPIIIIFGLFANSPTGQEYLRKNDSAKKVLALVVVLISVLLLLALL